MKAEQPTDAGCFVFWCLCVVLVFGGGDWEGVEEFSEVVLISGEEEVGDEGSDCGLGGVGGCVGVGG